MTRRSFCFCDREEEVLADEEGLVDEDGLADEEGSDSSGVPSLK